jgi:hypothetical protein
MKRHSLDRTDERVSGRGGIKGRFQAN